MSSDDAGFHHAFLTTPCIYIVFYLTTIDSFITNNSEVSEALCYQQDPDLGNTTATSSLSLTNGNASSIVAHCDCLEPSYPFNTITCHSILLFQASTRSFQRREEPAATCNLQVNPLQAFLRRGECGRSQDDDKRYQGYGISRCNPYLCPRSCG